MAGCLCHCLVDWLVGWLAGLIGWLVACFVDWLHGCLFLWFLFGCMCFKLLCGFCLQNIFLARIDFFFMWGVLFYRGCLLGGVAFFFHKIQKPKRNSYFSQ